MAEETKRIDNKSRTKRVCAATAAMTDERFILVRLFACSFVRFSDGPDHDNDTDIKHIKNYTHIQFG